MVFNLRNLLLLLTVAPHFVPEVLQKPSVRNPVAVSLGAIALFQKLVHTTDNLDFTECFLWMSY
jgi:hypothetical protein